MHLLRPQDPPPPRPAQWSRLARWSAAGTLAIAPVLAWAAEDAPTAVPPPTAAAASAVIAAVASSAASAPEAAAAAASAPAHAEPNPASATASAPAPGAAPAAASAAASTPTAGPADAALPAPNAPLEPALPAPGAPAAPGQRPAAAEPTTPATTAPAPAPAPAGVPVAPAPLQRNGMQATPLPDATAVGRASMWAATLPPELAAELKRRGVDARNVTLYVQAVDSSAPLVAMNEERSVTLASTTKLLTSMAALDKLGGAYRWTTRAYLQGRLKDGVLDGDLRLVGGGDPALDAQALLDWLQQWRKRGLRRINGHIVVDRRAFAFGAGDHDATPEPTPLNPHHAWPDALLVNQGRITLFIESDAAGAPAFSADLLPQGVTVQSRLLPLPPGQGCARMKRAPSVEVAAGADGSTTLTVVGEWARDCERRRIEVLALPSGEHALRSLHAAWLRVGGELGGSVIDAPAASRTPRGRPWAERSSAPLSEVLLEVNKWSNNVMARQVFLSLAPGFPAKPATLAAARGVFRQWLEGQGLSEADESTIAVDNGSGLSRDERGAVRVMAELLRRAWNRPQAKPMLSSLPLVGRDGTMAHRLQGSDVEGHAYIKTGTLSGVRAIAGYVQAKSGAVYAVVSVIQNGGGAAAQGALDRIIAWVYERH